MKKTHLFSACMLLSHPLSQSPIHAGAVARTNAVFGPGIGHIFLDDVKCNGLEYRLFDCAHSGLEVINCNHHQDAGVVCVEGKVIKWQVHYNRENQDAGNHLLELMKLQKSNHFSINFASH